MCRRQPGRRRQRAGGPSRSRVRSRIWSLSEAFGPSRRCARRIRVPRRRSKTISIGTPFGTLASNPRRAGGARRADVLSRAAVQVARGGHAPDARSAPEQVELAEKIDALLRHDGYTLAPSGRISAVRFTPCGRRRPDRLRTKAFPRRWPPSIRHRCTRAGRSPWSAAPRSRPARSRWRVHYWKMSAVFDQAGTGRGRCRVYPTSILSSGPATLASTGQQSSLLGRGGRPSRDSGDGLPWHGL